MSEAVVVGVRVRPFNSREQGLNATLCIDMQGETTTIINDQGVKKDFSFDQSFWSHDDFQEDGTGYLCSGPDGRYADQRYVYEKFGQRVLDNACAGYHCCLFAYGQTGAGKSYSMVGYDNNKGIVPITCDEIFKMVTGTTSPTKRYEICVSMVEIYNETVQDLFIPIDNRPRNGFQIRESKALGIYIDGIVKHAVACYSDIERVIDQGTGNRSVGSTNMNDTSSRAHTVITIEFKQVETVGAGTESVKVSNINLIDLAGSEKAGQTGAEGARFKEGTAINKSLSALGNVIEKLAQKSSSKNAKDILVPYRDSKLTRLLQNALGGSSKTIMICALSPASSNYEETLSTLRYADRAKKIKNSAVVNENPQEKLMRELAEENAKLKAMLEANSSAVNEQAEAEARENVAKLQEVLQEQATSFQEKLQVARQRDEDWGRRKTIHGTGVGMGNPVMVNLNAETQLTMKLKYEFPESETIVIGSGLDNAFDSGSSNSGSESKSKSKSSSSSSSESDDEDPPTILLASPGVHTKHCKVQNVKGLCYLTVVGEAGMATWINGVPFPEMSKQRRAGEASEDDKEDGDQVPPASVRLAHCDRLVLGKAIFLFVDPQQAIPEMIILRGEHSYAKARRELPSTWKGSVHEGGLKSFIKNMSISQDRRDTKMSLISRQESAGRKVSSCTLEGCEEVVGSLALSPYEDDGDEQSSLGEEQSEELIAKLKDDLVQRNGKITELEGELKAREAALATKDEEITYLRKQLQNVASPRSIPFKPFGRKGNCSFEEKVGALRATFQEALDSLEHTREALIR